MNAKNPKTQPGTESEAGFTLDLNSRGGKQASGPRASGFGPGAELYTGANAADPSEHTRKGQAAVPESQMAAAHHANFVVVGQAMSHHPGRSLLRAFLCGILGLVIAGAAVALRPEWRARALPYLKEARRFLLGREAEVKSFLPFTPKVVEAPRPKVMHDSLFSTPGQTQWGQTVCANIIQMGLGHYAERKLSLTEQVAVANCYLLADSPADAAAMLQNVETRLKGMSDARFFRRGRHTWGDALVTAVDAALRRGRDDEAQDLLNGRCATWTPGAPCVAKLSFLAAKGFKNAGEEGFTKLSAASLPASLQGRLWLSGALFASDRPALAQERYSQALALTPKDDFALRKTIYENEAMAALQNGQDEEVQSIVKAAESEFSALDSGSLQKLRFMRALAIPATTRKALTEFLGRGEIAQRAKWDAGLIALIGPLALRYEQGVPFSRFLARTHDYFAGAKEKPAPTSALMRTLAEWDIRTRLALGRYEGAMDGVTSYDKTFGQNTFSHYMRGLVLAAFSPNEQYQLLAAKQFQASLAHDLNWEGLYALGVTMIRAGRGAKVQPILNKLHGLSLTTGQRFWEEMLYSEAEISLGHAAEELPKLKAVLQKKPESFLAHELSIKAFQRLGKAQDAKAVQDAYDELRSRVAYLSTKEGMASPLGALALARRPVD